MQTYKVQVTKGEGRGGWGFCILGKHEHIQVIWKLYKHALNSLHDINIVFHIKGHGPLVFFPNIKYPQLISVQMHISKPSHLIHYPN